jgi:hypothetical protein
LCAIVADTGLGTVRTVVGKAEGTDRATKRTNELRKLESNRANMAAYRARDGLPKQITQLVNRGQDLTKRSGVSHVR